MNHLMQFRTVRQLSSRPAARFLVGCGLAALLMSIAATVAHGAPRDVQMREFDFVDSVIEIKNFGAVSEDLSGWRFCSHDEDQVRRYSSATGLNGVVLAPGESIFIHFLNDAPVGDPSRINASSLGAFATPFDRGPFAIQLYFAPVSFGNGNTIADHAQWSVAGVDDISADERSDEAETGGVWVDQSEWISTTAITGAIELAPASEGGVLHSPADYNATTPAVPGSGPIALTLLAAFLASFGLYRTRLAVR